MIETVELHILVHRLELRFDPLLATLSGILGTSLLSVSGKLPHILVTIAILSDDIRVNSVNE